METNPFRLTETVELNGAGTGTIRFSPSIGVWKVEQVAASTSTNTNEPIFSAYINGVFVGGSYSGSRTNDTSFNQRVNAQERLDFVWTGGDPGAIGEVTISGLKTA